MKNHQKYVEIALKIAQANDNFRIKHSAIIVYRNRIVGVGINSMKSDPLQARYSKNCHAIWIHAEIAAIKNALKVVTVDQLRKATIYIARYREDFATQGLSKPCIGCQRAIVAFGIGQIVYTCDSIGFEIVEIDL